MQILNQFFLQKDSLYCCYKCAKFSSTCKIIFIFSCILSSVLWDNFLWMTLYQIEKGNIPHINTHFHTHTHKHTNGRPKSTRKRSHHDEGWQDTHSHTHACTHTHTRTRTHTHTSTHTHTYKQTHTQKHKYIQKNKHR